MTSPNALHHTGITKPATITSQPAKRRSKWTMAISIRKATAMVVNGFMATLLLRTWNHDSLGERALTSQASRRRADGAQAPPARPGLSERLGGEFKLLAVCNQLDL